MTGAVGRRTALSLGAALAGGAVFGAPVAGWAQATRPQPPQGPILLPDTEVHLGAVRTVAVSADGALIATGSVDRSIRIWSGRTGRLLRRWHPPLGDGQIGSVDAVEFSPDGKLLFVTAVDWFAAPRGIIYVFDVETGSIRRVISGGPWRIPSLAVSPLGGVVAVATEFGGLATLRYDADLGIKTGGRSAPDSANPTLVVAFAPDGGSVATLLQKNLLRIFPVSDQPGEQAASLERRLPGEPVSLGFSADGRRIAIGLADRKISILDRGSGHLTTLEPPAGLGPGNLTLVAWGTGPDGAEWLFAGGTIEQPGGGNLVLAWREGRAGIPLTTVVAQDSLASMCRHPAGGIVFGSTDASWGRVVIGRAGNRLEATVTRSDRLDFRETTRLTWAIDASGEVIDFRAGLGQPPLRFDLAELRLSESAAWTSRPDLRKPRPAAVRLPADMVKRGERARSSDIAPGTGNVVIGADETLLLLDAKGQELARQPLATPAWAVAFSGDGHVIVAAHGDGTLRWYGMAPAARLVELGGLFVQAGRRRWVAWRNDGRFAYCEFGGETLVGIHENGRFSSSDPAGLTSRWTTVDQQYRRLYDPVAVRTMARPGPHWTRTGPAAPELITTAVDTAPSIRVVQVCSSAEATEQTRRTRMIASLNGQPTEDPLPGAVTPAPDACHAVQRTLQVGDGGTVQVDPATRAVRIRLALAANFAPVRVDAFVNGVNAGRAFYEPGQPAEQTLLLPAGPARIEFRAFNATAETFKRTAPIAVTRRTVAQGEPLKETSGDTRGATLHLLAVGIDRYAGTIPALRYAVSDADTFSETIRRVLPRSYDTLAPPVVLRDEAATLDAVRDAMVSIALRAKQTDAVMIYLSGHGVSVGGDYAFVTANVRDANAALERAEGCLRADDIVGLLSNIGAARTLMMLDTCFANAIDLQVGGRLGHETGRYILTASGSNEEALDGYDGVNGVFGHAVKEGLTNLAPSTGSVLDALELCRYVRDRVGTLAAQRRHNQRAHFQAAGELIDFPVSQLR